MLIFRLLLALAAITLSSQVFAMSDEALFAHARAAYASKNEIALSDDASQLKTQQYLLAPYADYWLMLLKLEKNNVRDEEVQNFLVQYLDMPFADRVRGEWLKKLGKEQNWGPFFEELDLFKRDDVAVQCYAMQGHTLLNDADVKAQAKALWLSNLALPSNCTQTFDALQLAEVLSVDDIWARFRLALQDAKLGVAKSTITRVPGFDTTNFKLLDRAYQSPKAFLENGVASYKSRFGAEANLYALDRLARTKIEDAISTYNKVQHQFEADNRAYGWGRVAYHAARSHHPQAVSFYAEAYGAMLDKEQLAWKVRAALREQDWQAVLDAVAAMQPKQLEEGAWRYWKARALKALGKNESAQLAEANAIFSKLSTERHFYGWLAAEELESVMSNPATDFIPTDNEVTAIASQLGIKRALALQRLDMRVEAKAEWVWAARGFDDPQLLAAAEYGIRQKWYDIAIYSADNTKITHNFNLRYPTPYRDLFHTSASNAGLDEAWVYGITRQESRFMHYAKSGVGAAGLMQLMPATAKWTAKRMGLDGYHNGMIHDLSTNIDLGTYYMRYTLDQMGGNAVMATAGYNAGPSRAKKWMHTKPLEAAIYIESIPFTETRGYVQKVMANAQIYAPRLIDKKGGGAKIQTLKARLGNVPGTGLPVITEEDSE
ncbi:MAG: transglycosylase SLT domain-containing protein [Methylotenera sp.]